MIDALPLLLGPEGYQISRSVRLRSSASAYFNRTPASAGNRKTWTWSGWVKRGAIGSGFQSLFAATDVTAANYLMIGINSDVLYFYGNPLVSGGVVLVTKQVLRDPSAWMHIIAVLDTTDATPADRAKLYINGVRVTSFTTNLAAAITLNANAYLNAAVQHNIGNRQPYANSLFDGYLTEINFIDGQALDPSYFGETNTTTGVWQPKKYTGTYGTNGFYLNFSDNSSRMALGWSAAGGTHVDIVENDGSNQTIITGVGACRVSTISTANTSGPSAVNEYLVITPSAPIPITSSLKIYVDVNSYSWATGRNLYINGTQVSSGNVTIAAVSGMQEWTINYSGHGITQLTSITLPQSSAGRCFLYGISIDGTTVVATANDWTPNNISVTAGVTYDSMLDVPTQWADGGNGRGNYATLNPLKPSGVTSNGNLTAPTSGVSLFSTIQLPTTGKWYAEFNPSAFWNTGSYLVYGAMAVANAAGTYSGLLATTNASNGGIYQSGVFNQAFTTWATTDVIGLAVDCGANTVQVYRNGSALGTAVTLPTGDLWFFVSAYSGGNVINANFGQRPFSYTPPTGFKALNTLNLPEPTILKGNQYFDATLYTGTGASLNVVNSGGMQPDFVWTKPRSTAVGHTLFDSLRGVTKYLQSNTTGAEGTAATSLTAFNSDGFTVNSDTSTGANGVTYVGWQWKANGTPAATNTDGSITSQVSVGGTQGFSIVTYTGTGANATVGHGLGVAPRMMIVKNRTTAGLAWIVYHASFTTPATQALYLNVTNAVSSSSAYWNNTVPTSSVFSIAAYNPTNQNTNAIVAYCFADVEGYSKFGSYVGNGSTDGPFVFCGFRPRFIMVKRTDSTSNWTIHDTSRDGYNVANADLGANSSAAEVNPNANTQNDILSNGFKVRHAGGAYNASGGTYIFAAFAENPFKYSLAR